MKQDVFVACSNEITKFEFDSGTASFVKACSVYTEETPGCMLLYGNILFVGFNAKIVSYLTGQSEITEISSVPCEGFSPCHLEFISSSNCLIAAGGDGGKNAVYSVIDGRILPSPHIFIHSFTDSCGAVRQGGFASCNKATNNPYRIASLDKENGTAIIANLYSNGGLTVRECSRINVGSEKGISDIVFTPTDIAYILCENSGEIILTDFHSGSGSLWPLKLLPFTNGYSTSQMCISKSGDTLFCLDKGENIISVFRLNDFSVKDLHKFSLGEKTNGFAVSSDGKIIFVACKNKISVYSCESDVLEKTAEQNISDPHIIIT